MKKVIAALLVLAMVFALAACGGGGNTAPAQQNTATNTNAATNTTPEAPKWPNGEVTIYEGYEEGSLTDINVQTIRDWIIAKTGAKVTIEADKNGGGANLANKLIKAEPDGQTMMLIGMNCISNYYNKIWTVNPADTSLFKVCCGMIQPNPRTGCMVLTQEDAPYSNWAEFEKYVKENPKKVTVMSIAGKVMDIKLKSLLNQTGLSQYVTWFPTNSADATTGLLGGTINIVILEENDAAKHLVNPDSKVKAIINCRPDDDFSNYDANTPNLDVIKSVPTLTQVFGAEKAEQYNVPNTSAFVVPANTPDEIVAQIRAVVDPLDSEPKSDDANSFYARCRINGGTSKYYAYSPEETLAEWVRIDPIIKAIVEMK